MKHFLLGFLLAAALILGWSFFLFAMAAYSGPPGPYHQWFTTQMQEPPNQTTPCCGDEEHFGGDGHYVQVRSIGVDRYEVFVPELRQWILYPRTVDPTHPNPTGQNVAWYVIYNVGDQASITWYCLRLAQGM